MNIGIDARLYDETGVGRYIQNLVHELSREDLKNHYILFLRKRAYDTFVAPNSRWEARLVDVPWHSVREQFLMPYHFTKAKLDLLHIPYFNVPILYFGKFVVTIHDLTILHIDTGKASTLPYLLYKIRRLGYYLAISAAVTRAAKIIAVSHVTETDIKENFDVLPTTIETIYEGVDEKLLKQKNTKRIVAEPYFLYVGNAYPHKNLELLVRAFEGVAGDSKLVFVGKDDFFYRRLKESAEVLALGNRIVFMTADDARLASLYAHADALVFPSRMEGFGLPAIEAFSLSCPVIASDIPVFHELLGEAPVYFHPTDGDALTRILKNVLGTPLRTPALLAKMTAIVRRYSWRDMAKRTLVIYENA